MKGAILVCLFACAVYSVYSEPCTTNGDCTSTSCASGSHVICEHKNEEGTTANGGLCTCAADNLACSTKADCLKSDITLTCISDDHKHCYDGKCICTRW